MECPRESGESIRFDDWKHAIQAANDLDEVMRVVRGYLGAWRAEDLATLPADVGALYVEVPDDVIARATIATRAELTASPHADSTLLREMALTLAAAATRLRRLTTNAGAAVELESPPPRMARRSSQNDLCWPWLP